MVCHVCLWLSQCILEFYDQWRVFDPLFPGFAFGYFLPFTKFGRKRDLLLSQSIAGIFLAF